MKFASVFRLLPPKIAYAHCDIPCGIYDPHQAQVAAHTIIRMTQFLGEVKRSASADGSGETRAEHDIARITRVKEEHGQLVEEEIGTLQNDYFKEEHYKEFTNLKDLLEKATKLSVSVRQNIDMKSAEELLETVMQIAEIFYKSKGLVPFRTKSPYPTEREIVLHK